MNRQNIIYLSLKNTFNFRSLAQLFLSMLLVFIAFLLCLSSLGLQKGLVLYLQDRLANREGNIGEICIRHFWDYAGNQDALSFTTPHIEYVRSLDHISE